jgi:hypothetical protein
VIDVQYICCFVFLWWPALRQTDVGILVRVRGGAAVGGWTDTCVQNVAARQTSLLCMSASAEVSRLNYCVTF